MRAYYFFAKFIRSAAIGLMLGLAAAILLAAFAAVYYFAA